MLKPAIVYKDEILNKFAEILYTEDYYLYTGNIMCTTLPKIEDKENSYQYAIVNTNNNIIGYLGYYIDPLCDNVFNFGLISFDKGNYIIGKDIFSTMEALIKRHHRLEWRVISDNPVIRTYDKFCEKYHGNKIVLHDVSKDMHGNYRDMYVYEIINKS